MPRPERHVFICTQSRPGGHPRGSCAEKGCAEVADALFSRMQTKPLWGKVTITQSGCIGPCDQGPNILVYPEGVMYAGVKPEDVEAIFEEHLVKGEPVERLRAPAEIW